MAQKPASQVAPKSKKRSKSSGASERSSSAVNLSPWKPYLKRTHLTSRMGAGVSTWAVPALCKAYSWPTSLTGGGIIAVIQPRGGWVQTDMGGASAPMKIEEGAKSAVQMALIGEDGPTGGFVHLGETLPW